MTTVPLSGPPAPVSAPPASASKKEVRRSWGGGGRLPFLGLPAVLAVLVVCVLSLLVALPNQPVPGGDARAPRPPQNTSQAAPAGAPQGGSAPQTASTQERVSPAARVYVVRPGDSLWKIFHSLGPEGRGGADWRDFLSRTSSANDLGDPDLIQPGAVLSITPQGR